MKQKELSTTWHLNLEKIPVGNIENEGMTTPALTAGQGSIGGTNLDGECNGMNIGKIIT